MDTTHRELVALLAGVSAALRAGDAAAARARFDRLIAHTADHFAQEEEWLHATSCPTTAEHVKQHAAVMHLMQTVGTAMRQERQTKLVAMAMDELKRWLPNHARGLDGDLARHMEAVGFVITPGERSRRLRATASERQPQPQP